MVVVALDLVANLFLPEAPSQLVVSASLGQEMVLFMQQVVEVEAALEAAILADHQAALA